MHETTVRVMHRVEAVATFVIVAAALTLVGVIAGVVLAPLFVNIAESF